jgi:hypothetical protein
MDKDQKLSVGNGERLERILLVDDEPANLATHWLAVRK